MSTEINEIEEVTKSENKTETIASTNVNTLRQEPLVNAQQTESFLLSEIESNKLIAKKTWTYGAIGVVVLALYFATMLSSVRSVVFDTAGIAAIMTSELDKKLPEQLANIENSLIAQAPQNSSNLVLAILSILPNVRKQGEHVIEEVYSSIPLMGEEITSAIKAYTADNKESIREFAKTHSEQEFAAYFMDELFANVMLDLDLHIKRQGEARGFGAVKDLSLKRLIALNSYLEKFAKTSRFDLTEKEQLERRALVTWLKILDPEK